MTKAIKLTNSIENALAEGGYIERPTGRFSGYRWNKRTDFRFWQQLASNGPRKVCHNTTVRYEAADNAVIFTLHYTDIVTLRPHAIQFNTGGWESVTTKTRMNQIAGWTYWPVWVYQEDYAWYLQVNGYEAGQSFEVGQRFAVLELPGLDDLDLPDLFIVAPKGYEMQAGAYGVGQFIREYSTGETVRFFNGRQFNAIVEYVERKPLSELDVKPLSDVESLEHVESLYGFDLAVAVGAHGLRVWVNMDTGAFALVDVEAPSPDHMVYYYPNPDPHAWPND